MVPDCGWSSKGYGHVKVAQVVTSEIASQQVSASHVAAAPEQCTSLPLFTGLAPLQGEKLSHVAFASVAAFTPAWTHTQALLEISNS